MNELQDVTSKKIYVRCFDLVNENNTIKKVSTINWKSLPEENWEIIPVIYLQNGIFSIDEDSLACKLTLALQNVMQNISFREIQIDCDWTEDSKEKYFQFLHDLKNQFSGVVSVTIRLHQIKFKERTGVPPVDYGVLMYYNMGKISSDPSNSILDNSIGVQYLDRLSEYPLALNIALPTYSWYVQVRDGVPIGLITKWERQPQDEPEYFQSLSNNRYKALRSGFLSGKYIQVGDELKLEKCSNASLEDAADLLAGRLPKKCNEVLFFELDSKHISAYEASFLRSFVNSN